MEKKKKKFFKSVIVNGEQVSELFTILRFKWSVKYKMQSYASNPYPRYVDLGQKILNIQNKKSGV